MLAAAEMVTGSLIVEFDGGVQMVTVSLLPFGWQEAAAVPAQMPKKISSRNAGNLTENAKDLEN